MNELSFRCYYGSEIEEIIPQLGELRIKVFYDFPYLYDGDLTYETEYLKIYTSHPASIVYAVFDGSELVGATTGIPLIFESEEVKKPFRDLNHDLEKIYYFGESILLKNYRGLGLGHRFFDVREKHALLHGFEITTFCSVVRSDNHALKPGDYRSNDAFWSKRGYLKQAFSCHMSWLDRNMDYETKKELQFWAKQWVELADRK